MDGNCPGWELSGMGNVRWELSGMGTVRDGNCPGWKLSGMGIVRESFKQNILSSITILDNKPPAQPSSKTILSTNSVQFPDVA